MRPEPNPTETETSPMSAIAVPDSIEVAQLDESKEDNGDEAHGGVCNLSADMDTTQVNFDGTLPPGVAPDGFLILDEDVGQSQPQASEDPQPIFKILFRDASAFQKYHGKIKSFLKELLLPDNGRKHIKSRSESLLVEIFDSNSSSSRSSNSSSSNDRQHSSTNDVGSKNWEKHNHANSSFFTIDTKPKPMEDLDIPMYRKKFNVALQKPQDEPSEVKEDCAPKISCFNCLGNHSLRDCEEPRNYLAINKNRKSYNSKRGFASNVRYHLDDNQKFGHFIPGQITPKLRKALGLNDNELPRHIYRMRILGYPPGWLEEARLQHSGLALFNSDGNIDAGSDEEGEIVCPGDKDKYDIKKIIDFPGFNVESPYGTREECKQYWGSSMQKQYSKSAMLCYLSNKKVADGYVRKKLPNPANLKSRADVNPSEMEIDDIDETKEEAKASPPPPLPTPTPTTTTTTTTNPKKADGNNDDVAPDSNPEKGRSPSLVGEEGPAAASEEAATGDAPPSPPPGPDVGRQRAPDESSATDETKADVVDVETKAKAEEAGAVAVTGTGAGAGAEADESGTAGGSEIEDVNNVTPKNSCKTQSVMPGSAQKSIIAIHLGTPILKSTSPYRKLPNSEKFSKDICDVINFENLTDSTGKYDQMSELLQKVRSTISELHKEQ